MALVILHTGQSGVERGADRAARAVGLPIQGFSTFERRDELGSLPPEIAATLTPCPQRGARSALRATLELANVLVIAVPDARDANSNTGIEALRRAARAGGVPHWLVDSSTDLDALALRLRGMERITDPLHVLITGPRFTRWHAGEKIGWRIVAQLALEPEIVTPRKHRILVVDDHEDLAETNCALLRSLGHECIAATTGARALELAGSFQPDVGLFDIGLPDLSGYELARRVRATQQTPIFLAAITGWDQAKDAERALAAGFDRHIIKPTNTAIIRGLIDQADSVLAA